MIEALILLGGVFAIGASWGAWMMWMVLTFPPDERRAVLRHDLGPTPDDVAELAGLSDQSPEQFGSSPLIEEATPQPADVFEPWDPANCWKLGQRPDGSRVDEEAS